MKSTVIQITANSRLLNLLYEDAVWFDNLKKVSEY